MDGYADYQNLLANAMNDYNAKVSNAKETYATKLASVDAVRDQIEKATEVFGPVGVGWGWSVSDPILPNNDTVAFKISLWHGNKDQVVEQFGQAALTAGSRADNDAFKKAVTDGLTKCLSYLGFNADVFLGKFDDSKYVQHARHMAKQNEPSLEAKNVKNTCGEDFLTVVPGIRPNNSATNDQKRILTPSEAIKNGADILIVGRPITQAKDPNQAARIIKESIIPYER